MRMGPKMPLLPTAGVWEKISELIPLDPTVYSPGELKPVPLYGGALMNWKKRAEKPTRVCKNPDCNIGFIPTSDRHLYHSKKCGQVKYVKKADKIAAESDTTHLDTVHTG